MRVLVGITGGIAAFKAAEIVREFTESGHEVKVIATPNALRFIGSATLEALSHNPVYSDLYANVEDVQHIELAKWAEVLLVAPATASFLARTASGIANDLLGNVLLATTAPKVIAPAMHSEMWLNPSTVANVATLRARGFNVIEPVSGRLTGSDSGIGRLPNGRQLVATALGANSPKDLLGQKVLVIAGGTREFIDPVRYIGNRSSGKQGIALAQVAKARGADVTLIAANFDYESSEIKVFEAVTADDVLSTLNQIGFEFDVVVMPAAISDFKSETVSERKLKKSAESTLDLHLVQNPDIISLISRQTHQISKKSVVVGFAAETESGDELISLAKEKLERKGLDLVIANDVSNGRGFDSDANSVFIVSKNTVESVSGTKREIASKIFDAIGA